MRPGRNDVCRCGGGKRYNSLIHPAGHDARGVIGTETVYDLRVKDCHADFVGAPEWGFAVWAHNAYNVANFAGKTRADAHIAIRQAGYNHHGTTAGGYVRYRHPSGAELQIRPNGEVIRLGPPNTPSDGGRPYRLRIDHTGNAIPTHNTGEFLPPLPPRRLP